MLPDLIIAGVVKGGTTSLYRYLNDHPSFLGSKIKETCYFLPLRYEEEIRDFSSYIDCFPEGKGIRFEATPGYFHGGKRLANTVKQLIPDVKICIVLRDPIERLHSFYKYQLSHLNIPEGISYSSYVDKCLKVSKKDFLREDMDPYFGVEGSLYYKSLEEWVSVFGSRSIMIIDFDSLVADPLSCVNDLCAFVGVPKMRETYAFGVENKTRIVKYSFVHRLALHLNQRSEVFFRRFPKVKEMLRTLYFSINPEVYEGGGRNDLSSGLMQLFSSDVQKSKKYLQDKGLNVPEWMWRYD